MMKKSSFSKTFRFIAILILFTALVIDIETIAAPDCKVNIDGVTWRDANARTKIVSNLIDSISDVAIIPGSQLNFDVATTSGNGFFENLIQSSQTGDTLVFSPFLAGTRIRIESADLRSGDFEMMNSGVPAAATASKAFTGVIQERNQARVFIDQTDSFVALYARENIYRTNADGDQELDKPGFVSGFVISGIGNGQTWYVIEPARPLLWANADPDGGSESIFGNPGFDVDRLDIEVCFTDGSHLIYQVNQTQNNNLGMFNLELDSPDAGDLSNLAFNKSKESLLKGESASLTIIGDSAYNVFYENVIREKYWWEGQEEIVNLVSAFFGRDLEFSMKIRSLEIWRTNQGGPGEIDAFLRGHKIVNPSDPETQGLINDLDPPDGDMDINALQLLCHYAQGIALDEGMQEVMGTAASAMNDPVVEISHRHGTQETHTLVQLFTGYDLSSTLVSDSGGGFCPDGCGGTTGNNPRSVGDLVGMAEGRDNVGGGIVPTSCSDLQPNQTQSGPLRLFEDPGHHSISQQVPERELCGEDNPCESGINSNYQATLFQRFLIAAHEIGHTLGFKHCKENSQNLMQSPLNNDIKFQVFDETQC